MKTTSQIVPSSEQRAADAGRHRGGSSLAPLALAPNPQSAIQNPKSPRRSRRAGISLLEVLIAMFVMLFGLMGVAAIMPVGNHYAARSDQYDRGAALAGNAFAELKARGLLKAGYQLPDGSYYSAWRYANSSPVIATDGGLVADPGHAFVIDAIGSAEAVDVAANMFPYGAPNSPWGLTPPSTTWPIRRVTMAAVPTATPVKMPSQVAATIFRLHDDLSGDLPDQGDRPGIQRWETVDNNPANGNPNNTPDFPADDTLLARAYAGSYSWLATVLPVNADALLGLAPASPRHGSFLYEVSVAVFRKREDAPSTTSERLLQAELGPGGDLVIYDPSDATIVDDASQDIRPGNWVALAGVHPTTGKFLLKWYRLLSYDDETENVQLYSAGSSPPGRRAMLEGAEWPPDVSPPNVQYSTNLRAILLPNVIGVATQTVKLETN